MLRVDLPWGLICLYIVEASFTSLRSADVSACCALSNAGAVICQRNKQCIHFIVRVDMST